MTTPTRSVLIRTRERLIDERNYWRDLYTGLLLSTTARNINLQKQIASVVYKKVSLVDPGCILVGGAPRDWYFDREASDLDFFFVPNKDVSIEDVMSLLDMTVVSRVGTADHHLCKQMPGPLKLWESEFNGIKIQLVEISSKDLMSIAVDELHLSISKIYWTPEKGIQIHQEFKETVRSKVITGKDGYDLKSKYAQKILYKYRDLGYSFG